MSADSISSLITMISTTVSVVQMHGNEALSLSQLDSSVFLLISFLNSSHAVTKVVFQGISSSPSLFSLSSEDIQRETTTS